MVGAHVVQTNCCDFRRAQVCWCDFTPVYHFQIPCSVAGLGSRGFVEGVVRGHMARNCRPTFEVSLPGAA